MEYVSPGSTCDGRSGARAPRGPPDRLTATGAWTSRQSMRASPRFTSTAAVTVEIQKSGNLESARRAGIPSPTWRQTRRQGVRHPVAARQRPRIKVRARSVGRPFRSGSSIRTSPDPAPARDPASGTTCRAFRPLAVPSLRTVGKGHGNPTMPLPWILPGHRHKAALFSQPFCDERGPADRGRPTVPLRARGPPRLGGSPLGNKRICRRQGRGRWPRRSSTHW